MTVAELMAELRKQPPERVVAVVDTFTEIADKVAEVAAFELGNGLIVCGIRNGDEFTEDDAPQNS